MSERTTAGTGQPVDGNRDRRDMYDLVIRAVARNTGPARSDAATDQPPGATAPTVAGAVVAHQSREGDRSLGAYRSALSAALDNGDLIEWYGEDGRRRLTTTDTESLIDLARRGYPHVDGDAAAVLRQLAAHHAEQSDPNTDLIGAINAALVEVNADE